MKQSNAFLAGLAALLAVCVLVVVIITTQSSPTITTTLLSDQSAQVVSSFPTYHQVGKWTFDGNANDSSGYGQAFTNSNATYVSGHSGQAISFTGNASGAVSARPWSLSGTPATVAFWMNAATPTVDTTIFELSPNMNDSPHSFAMFFDATDGTCPAGTLELDINGIGTKTNYNVKCYSYPGSGWHHYAAIFDKGQNAANEITLYIDGNPVTPVSQPHATNNVPGGFSTYNFYIGSRAGTSQFMKATYDEMYLYNGALTTAEVQAVKNGTIVGRNGILTFSNVSSTVTDTTATITWKTDKIANDDTVAYGLTDAYGSETAEVSRNSIDHSITITGLKANTLYHYKPMAELGDYKDVTDHTFTTLPQSGNKPPTVSFTISASKDVAPVDVTITANASDSDGTISKVEFYVNSTLQLTDTTSPYVYSRTGVPAGTYTVYVRAIDNKSAVTNAPSQTATVKPATGTIQPPTNITATAVSSTQINLSWTLPAVTTGITGYKIYRCPGNVTSCSTFLMNVTPATANTFQNSSISTPSTVYTYQVSSYNATAESTKTAPVSTSTLANGTAASTKFRVGDSIRTTAAGVKVRATPSTSGTEVGTVTTSGTTGTVQNASATGYVNGVFATSNYWWYVRIGSYTGWTSETNLATTTPVTYTITTSAGTNGTISPANPSVTKGTNQTFSITPASGYKVATLTVDNVSVATSTSYTIPNVQTTHSVAATFAPGGNPSTGDWYVRKGGSGTKTSSCTTGGTNWNTAWGEMNQINWSCVQPGNTVWLAGGNYTTTLSPGASGNANNWIKVKRVLASDRTSAGVAITNVTGWNGGYDSQAVVTANPSISYAVVNVGSYMSWDGRVDSGIRLKHGNTTAANTGASVSFDYGKGGQQYITFDNIDFAGAFGSGPDQPIGDFGVLNLNDVSYITFTNSRIHGDPTLAFVNYSDHITFDHCKLYDSVAGNAIAHQNVWFLVSATDFTVRYSEISNWAIEGFITSGNSGPIYVYGNVFHHPYVTADTYVNRVFEPRTYLSTNGGVQGPLYVYNNVFSGVNMIFNYVSDESARWAAGSIATNNVVLNSSSWDSSIGPTSMNLITSTNPFISATDFRLTAPRPGIVIPSVSGHVFNTDPIGVTRGSDGVWDIGAYEYTGATLAPDTQKPVTTSFTAPTTAASLTISPIVVTATDNAQVTGYMVNESATPPTAGAAGWLTSAPTSYTVASAGAKTLYAWAKDAAGNVSNAFTGRSVGVTTINKFTINNGVRANAEVNVRTMTNGVVGVNPLGTQAWNAIGTVIGGPVSALLGQIMHIWWNINFSSGIDGWVGEDGLDAYTASTNVTAALSANTTSVTSGGSATLSWSSTNANSCNATGGIFAGPKSTSGSGVSTGSLTQTTTYGISCVGASGTSPVANVTVTVGTPQVSTGNLYVRPGGAGSRNGTDWNNAWDIGGIVWANVQPGNTIWLAGGNYTTQLSIQKSGTAEAYINLKRVRTTDSVPAASPGWSTSFDSQVVVAPTNNVPAYWGAGGNVGSYVSIDGRVENGIKFKLANLSYPSYPAAVYFDSNMSGVKFVTLNYVEMAGPVPAGAMSYSGNGYLTGLAFRGGPSGGSGIFVTDITVTNCNIHGAFDLVLLVGVQRATFDHCKFADSVFDSGTFSAHPNIMEWAFSGDITVKNSEFTNWYSEGIMMGAQYDPDPNPYGPLYLYGNVFHNPNNGQYSARAAEARWKTQTIYSYNNTFINFTGNPYVYGEVNGNGQWSTASKAMNNIYLNSQLSSPPASSNNYSSLTSPLVSATDFRLKAALSGAAALPAPFNVDPTGKIRGSDGVWDIGAYDY